MPVKDFFLPDKQLLQEHIKSRTSLLSIETGRPLADFKVIFVMLSFEMDYDNLLTVLDLGNIKLRAAERNEKRATGDYRRSLCYFLIQNL